MLDTLPEEHKEKLIIFHIVATIIAFIIVCFIGGVCFGQFAAKNNNQNIQNGKVYMITASGRINFGDFKGQVTRDKNGLTTWTDFKGDKHMTTAPLLFDIKD